MSAGKDGGGAAVSYLYRFRSIKNLLDRGELENQEIYLAPPEAMNGPTEGIKDGCLLARLQDRVGESV
jgi:hypothetical protein